jgi:hypothetical protein
MVWQGESMSLTTKIAIAGLSVVLLSALSARAQGTFQNLDFEDANLSPIPAGQFGGFVPIASALPDWAGYLGSTPVTQVLQDNYTLGAAEIDIIGPNWGPVIEGQYTVVLEPGTATFSGSGGFVSASISQTGVVPENAASLQFKAETSTPFSVSMGGDNLSLFPLGTGANLVTGAKYTLYGANISGFEGQVETLTITALAGPNNPDYFDSFNFSTTTVPEPSVVELMVIGGLLFGALSWFARRGPFPNSTAGNCWREVWKRVGTKGGLDCDVATQ